MDPANLAMSSMGASGGGGILSGIGSFMSGQSQAKAYEYQAGVAKINEQIAKQNADYAFAAGEVEAQEAGMKTRAQVGETIAQQGAGGLAIGSGSNARVVQSEKEIGAENVGIIRSNAAKRAYGYQVEAVGEEAKSQLLTSAATSAKTSSFISGLTSFIGAGGSVADKWMKASQVGIFGGSSPETGSKGIVS